MSLRTLTELEIYNINANPIKKDQIISFLDKLGLSKEYYTSVGAISYKMGPIVNKCGFTIRISPSQFLETNAMSLPIAIRTPHSYNIDFSMDAVNHIIDLLKNKSIDANADTILVDFMHFYARSNPTEFFDKIIKILLEAMQTEFLFKINKYQK